MSTEEQGGRNVLEVEHLCVRAGDRVILDDLSFCLGAGEYLAIVGPNGAGKSTLVRSIIGDNRHVSGNIRFHPQIRQVGYVAQQNDDGHFFPATSAEVIRSGLAWRHFHPFLSAAERERIGRICGELKINHLLNEPFYQLSGGQKRAVLIARAFVASERLLILDEPTAGLDPEAADRLFASVHRLNARFHSTICMVSHDVPRVLREADTVLCLEHRISFLGPADKFRDTPICEALIEHSV